MATKNQQAHMSVRNHGFVQGLMRSLKLLPVIALLSASVLGCDKKQTAAPVQTRGGTTSAVPESAASIQLKGIVYTDAKYQDQFQDAVRGFMNAWVPGEEYVGYVSARAEQGTGVYFGGRIQLANGNIRALPGGQTQVASTSDILVAVYDKFDNQADLAPLPGVYMANAQGHVSGNTATIRFTDGSNWIQLQGQFDSNYFSGTFSFDNKYRYNSTTPGGEGSLGSFQIPVCDIFACQ